jgi:hypothetical protein
LQRVRDTRKKPSLIVGKACRGTHRVGQRCELFASPAAGWAPRGHVARPRSTPKYSRPY